jgi:hypothetical protein
MKKPKRCLKCKEILSTRGRPSKSGYCSSCSNKLREGGEYEK